MACRVVLWRLSWPQCLRRNRPGFQGQGHHQVLPQPLLCSGTLLDLHSSESRPRNGVSLALEARVHQTQAEQVPFELSLAGYHGPCGGLWKPVGQLQKS